MQLDALGEQHLPRLIVGDITPEALVVRLAEQKGRIALLSDEGSELFNGLRRRAVGGVEQVDHLLKAYSGTTINVDRKGSGTILIPDPALTIGVSVQPSVLRGLVNGHASTARGFLERFLFSVPEPVESRNQGGSGIDLEAHRDYCATVRRLLDLPAYDRGAVDAPQPPRLVLDDQAAEAMRAFSIEIDQRSRGDGDLVSMFEWCSKLRGNVARIAAVLHLYDDPTGPAPGRRIEISPAAVDRAIQVGRYCMAHAQIAYGIGGLVADEDVQAVLGWIRRQHQTVVRVRDLHRGMQSRCPTAESLKRVLGPLVEDGYLRPRPAKEARVGRPSTDYEVNPALLGAMTK